MKSCEHIEKFSLVYNHVTACLVTSKSLYTIIC